MQFFVETNLPSLICKGRTVNSPEDNGWLFANMAKKKALTHPHMNFVDGKDVENLKWE